MSSPVTVLFGAIMLSAANSCSGKANRQLAGIGDTPYAEIQRINKPFAPNPLPPIVANDPALRDAAAGLAGQKIMYGKYIGYEMRKSDSWDLDSIIGARATDAQLEALTDYPGVVLKATAFRYLAMRNRSKAAAIFKKHIDDKSILVSVGGCFHDEYPVNQYFYSLISDQLSKKERIDYVARVACPECPVSMLALSLQ
jgi:hypothetical protein